MAYTFKNVVAYGHFIDETRKAEIRRSCDGYFTVAVIDRITNAVIAEYKFGKIDDGKYVIINKKNDRTVAVRESFTDILECLNKALFKKSQVDFFRMEELCELF